MLTKSVESPTFDRCATSILSSPGWPDRRSAGASASVRRNERRIGAGPGLRQRVAAERLAAAEPVNDGKQTPMRGHPVFIAQHATGTCCRSCLQKWHGIPAGHPLSEAEQEHVVAAIGRWLEQQR